MFTRGCRRAYLGSLDPLGGRAGHDESRCLVSHFLKINATCLLGGSNYAVNTWTYSGDGAQTFGVTDAEKTAQANAAITQLKAFYATLSAAGLFGTWVIGQSVVEYETGEDPAYVVATPQTQTAGAGSTGPLQPSAVITLRTALAGKSFRGRKYIGPLYLGALAANLVSTGFVTACNNAIATLIAAPTGSHLVPAIWSKTLDVTNKITSGSSSQQLRTMRSRAS